VDIPVGVVTSIFGAPALVWLARRHRDSGPTSSPPRAGHPAGRPTWSFLVILGVTAAVTAGVIVVSVLAGDRWVLLGDVANWMRGTAGGGVTFVLDQRIPRVLLGLLCGAALALAGTVIQAVARNPLAEPATLGISGGAGVGAVALLVLAPAAATSFLSVSAALGGLLAFTACCLVAWRCGLGPVGLGLVGVGVHAFARAVPAMLVLQREYDLGPALVWLSGSTYGRTLGDAAPLAVAVVVMALCAFVGHRYLD